MADLRHLLATYVHAHQTGNSVPPHIDTEARATLAAKRPAPAEPDTDAVLDLAAIIREVDGNNSLGAAALAEAILAHPNAASVFQPTAPTPAADPLPGFAATLIASQRPMDPDVAAALTPEARWEMYDGAPAPAADGERDHVPDAGNMVAADGEREELAAWLQFEADNAQELGCATIYDHDRLRWAASYLRQLPPEGLEAIRYCVEEDGAVIQRTSRAPESWAIRAGSACMSTTGEWDTEPMPSDRTDEWLANHRWPSAAAAWEALQQARRREVGDE